MASSLFLGRLQQRHTVCFHNIVSQSVRVLYQRRHISSQRLINNLIRHPPSTPKCALVASKDILRKLPKMDLLCVRTLMCSRSDVFRKCLHVKDQPCFVRQMSNGRDPEERLNLRSTLIYICAVGIFMLGMSYAGVPLYRMFCQATGLGGQAVQGHDTTKVEFMKPVQERVIRVRFNADVASSMRWNFKPQQTDVKVVPGETALAFYTAKNPTDKPIIGISTYNVVPFEAGQYFNKIQCFCFEEQRLNPHEQVDMPVFFYIDPEYAEDAKLQTIDTITLSYTFFEAKEGLQLPLPGYATS
ncbi:cytochrome c oxidase assembly protein COX11, mitochondrial-like [Haliotis rubra]|uniref:cytochrome c oxidase assembly protein COX11, mitochondrial-like n=1 Tax=Haliotis rubra TaxID=36100 RepID=UPI001EE5F5C9|nr:cytochrome c oxidase assembly protein COX11, mitochondrial-like [Haliotis rubra]XP_046554541.1 cytochrome c oxidase assembly protein COX11, mitochondrial-like [Haliotis rubra]